MFMTSPEFPLIYETIILICGSLAKEWEKGQTEIHPVQSALVNSLLLF